MFFDTTPRFQSSKKVNTPGPGYYDFQSSSFKKSSRSPKAKEGERRTTTPRSGKGRPMSSMSPYSPSRDSWIRGGLTKSGMPYEQQQERPSPAQYSPEQKQNVESHRFPPERKVSEMNDSPGPGYFTGNFSSFGEKKSFRSPKMSGRLFGNSKLSRSKWLRGTVQDEMFYETMMSPRTVGPGAYGGEITDELIRKSFNRKMSPQKSEK